MNEFMKAKTEYEKLRQHRSFQLKVVVDYIAMLEQQLIDIKATANTYPQVRTFTEPMPDDIASAYAFGYVDATCAVAERIQIIQDGGKIDERNTNSEPGYLVPESNDGLTH